MPCFALLVVASLMVPVLGERHGWHAVEPRAHRRALRPVHPHRAGRVRALGIDALGSVIGDTEHRSAVWGIAAGGLLLVFSMWWKYFAAPRRSLTSSRKAFVWELRPPGRLRLSRRRGC
jgi:hypothetical protein